MSKLVCLSGGGFRAALFHAGVLRALYEQRQRWCGNSVDYAADPLPDTVLSCVSGGAIIGAIWGLPARMSYFDSYGPEKVLSQIVSTSPFSKVGGVISVPVLENTVQRVQLMLGRALSLGQILPVLGRLSLWAINFNTLIGHIGRHLERACDDYSYPFAATPRPVKLGHLSSRPLPIFQTLNISESRFTFWQANYIGEDPDRVFSSVRTPGRVDPMDITVAHVVALCMAHLASSGPVRIRLNGPGDEMAEFHGDAGIIDNMGLFVQAVASQVTNIRPTVSSIDTIVVSDAGAKNEYHRGFVNSRIKANWLNFTQTEMSNILMARTVEDLTKQPRGLIDPARLYYLIRNQEALGRVPTGFQKISIKKQAEILLTGYEETMKEVFSAEIPKIRSSVEYRRLGESLG